MGVISTHQLGINTYSQPPTTKHRLRSTQNKSLLCMSTLFRTYSVFVLVVLSSSLIIRAAAQNEFAGAELGKFKIPTKEDGIVASPSKPYHLVKPKGSNCTI